jgi:hypothetical protein
MEALFGVFAGFINILTLVSKEIIFQTLLHRITDALGTFVDININWNKYS